MLFKISRLLIISFYLNYVTKLHIFDYYRLFVYNIESAIS